MQHPGLSPERPRRWEAERRNVLLTRPIPPPAIDPIPVQPVFGNGCNVMLERALALNPKWGERASKGGRGKAPHTVVDPPRLMFAEARLIIGDREHDPLEYGDAEEDVWPVKADRIEIRMRVQTDDGEEVERLPSDLALTERVAANPGRAWAVVTEDCSLQQHELAELLMAAYSGPPEVSCVPDMTGTAQHWAAASTVARIALDGREGLLVAATALARDELERNLPVRLGRGEELRLKVTTRGDDVASYEVAGWLERSSRSARRLETAPEELRRRYAGTAFETWPGIFVGSPVDDAEHARLVGARSSGEPVDALGEPIDGRLVSDETGLAVIWTIATATGTRHAVHRLTKTQAEAVHDMVNEMTVRTLARRNRGTGREAHIRTALEREGLR